MKIFAYSFMLLVMLSCKDEIEFNPNVHIATADAVNFEVSDFNASARLGNGSRLVSSGSLPVKFSSLFFQYDVGNNVDLLHISLSLPFSLTNDCERISPDADNVWSSMDSFVPHGFALSGEWDTVGEKWTINDEAGDSFVCIESISDTGEEVSGTFDLHFKKINGRILPNSRWPDTFSLLNGKFRAFVLNN